jgi:hypothetical protein
VRHDARQGLYSNAFPDSDVRTIPNPEGTPNYLDAGCSELWWKLAARPNVVQRRISLIFLQFIPSFETHGIGICPKLARILRINLKASMT